jgi:hypothetical protein
MRKVPQRLFSGVGLSPSPREDPRHQRGEEPSSEELQPVFLEGDQAPSRQENPVLHLHQSSPSSDDGYTVPAHRDMDHLGWSEPASHVDPDGTRRMIEELEDELSNADWKIYHLDERLGIEREEVHTLKHELRLRNSEYEKLVRDANAHIQLLKDDLETYHCRIRRLEEEKRMQQAELDQKDKVMSEKEDLLRARTTELKSAETFLSTADTMSGAELIRLVEDLNNEIYQTAATLIDSFPYDATIDDDPTYIEGVGEHFGQNLMSHWHSVVRRDDVEEFDILLQYLLQHVICRVLWFIISSWTPDNQRSRQLIQLYTAIKDSGNCSISLFLLSC